MSRRQDPVISDVFLNQLQASADAKTAYEQNGLLGRLEAGDLFTRPAGRPQTFIRKRYGSVVLEKDVVALLGMEAAADPMISGWRHA